MKRTDWVKPPNTNHGLKNHLADEVGELVSAAAGYGIQFNVTIEAGTDESLPDDVEARLNEILRRVSDDLEL
mgnify:CR=1 FL=1